MLKHFMYIDANHENKPLGYNWKTNKVLLYGLFSPEPGIFNFLLARVVFHFNPELGRSLPMILQIFLKNTNTFQ